MSRKFRLARAASPIALAACLAFAFSSAALAAGNDWNHHWGHNNGWHGSNNYNSGGFGIYLGGPGYYAPPPAYYAPSYYAPAPGYYGAPGYYSAPGYYAPQPSVGFKLNVQ